MKTTEQISRMIEELLLEGDSVTLEPKIAKQNKDLLKFLNEAKTTLEFGATKEGLTRQLEQLNEQIERIDVAKNELRSQSARSRLDKNSEGSDKRKQRKFLQYLLD